MRNNKCDKIARDDIFKQLYNNIQIPYYLISLFLHLFCLILLTNRTYTIAMRDSCKRAITDVAFVLLNLAMTTVSCMLLLNLNKIIRVVTVLAFLLICILIPTVSGKSKTIHRLLIISSIFLSLVVIGYTVLDQTGWLYYFKDFEKIKAIILSTKQWGVMVFLLITIFGVVVLPIPSAVTILIGVAIYGPFWSFVLSTLGTYIGSFFAFMLGRSFGKKLVAWLCGAEKTEKYSKLLSDKGKILFVIMMLFPFFPDDILCMVAGISNMNKRYFMTAMMLTRPIMIGFTAFLGSGEIIPFSGWGIPVWISLFALVLIAFFAFALIKSKIEKNKGKAKNGINNKSKVETNNESKNGDMPAVKVDDNCKNPRDNKKND